MAGPIGGPSELAWITRVRGERGQGSSALYAFGYADFAEVIGEEPWVIAGAVVDGLFEPLSLVELAIASVRGLGGLADLITSESSIRARRPAAEREVAKVKIVGRERPYGLGDLWAFGHADIAAQTQRETFSVWNSQKNGFLMITDLHSVIGYVTDALPERKRVKLGLQ